MKFGQKNDLIFVKLKSDLINGNVHALTNIPDKGHIRIAHVVYEVAVIRSQIAYTQNFVRIFKNHAAVFISKIGGGVGITSLLQTITDQRAAITLHSGIFPHNGNERNPPFDPF
ncbi:MAG TPA: hypothetical protein VGN64_23475, partial [Dyadobacter sp.]|nr:hypothetical protein [Dyadobacter sp.]